MLPALNIMADHADDNDDDGDIFIYRGGQAPHVTHARIDKSVDEIEDCAFSGWDRQLLKVDTHDGIRKIGRCAFFYCKTLPRINLKSVVQIDREAFNQCENLADVEFGDRLETIGLGAFGSTSLTHLKLPSIITIGLYAFNGCKRLIDIELSEQLQTIRSYAFKGCDRLERIAIPLKRDLFEIHPSLRRYTQFEYCMKLTTVDIVGGIHKTVASLHMESWRAEMIAEINRINEVLPNTPAYGKGGAPADKKTHEIKRWMDSVIDKMDYHRSEHARHVREGTTLLELALWKAKLDEKEESSEEGKTKKVQVDSKSARKERRITCGADIVIKNVLPFLQFE